MPRGVPASGKRQPSAAAAVEPAFEETLAESAAYEPGGVDLPAVEQVPGVDSAPEELTAEQLEIKYLRDQLAKASGKKDVEPEYDDAPAEGEVIRIHFLEDGLTVNGRVMYRGEELEFAVGGQAYQQTFNRNGYTWLVLRNDEFGQVDRFGKIMFRNGPWPGKTYADGTFETLRVEKGDGNLTPPTAAQIEAAEKARLKRAAPKLPSLI